MEKGSDKYGIKIKSASASDPEFNMSFACYTHNISSLKVKIEFQGKREYASQLNKYAATLTGVQKDRTEHVNFKTEARSYGYKVGEEIHIKVTFTDTKNTTQEFEFLNGTKDVRMTTSSDAHSVNMTMQVQA